MSTEKQAALDIVWDYMKLNLKQQPVEVVFALGSRDDAVAKVAAQLFKELGAKYLLISGGETASSLRKWDCSEAERFGAVAVAEGIAKDRILLESRALAAARAQWPHSGPQEQRGTC